MDKLNFIINRFDKLLEKTDKDYREKIFFSVTYNMKGEHFNINIIPCESGFNSRDYFINRFEGKEGLAKFADENNIGLITY
jgi:hypothetical protein